VNAPRLSAVIPVYNEEESLLELIRRSLAACGACRCAFEIILVDDGSRDGSRKIISQATDRHEEVVGVFLNRNYGKHAAVFAGLEQSRSETIVTLDADLQNPPEEIPHLVQEIDQGVDVLGPAGELTYGFQYQDAAGRLRNADSAKRLIERNREKPCSLTVRIK